ERGGAAGCPPQHQPHHRRPAGVGAMSVYLHVTLEIHAAGLGRFLEGMEKTAVPFLETQGWRLTGAFVQRTGRLGNVIDLWELDDFQHYDRALQAFMADPAF